MDTSTAQWPQGIGLVKPITMDHHHNNNQDDQIRNGNALCNIRAINGGGDERRAITRPQEQVNCPRCNSSNTKFCYYNNYSLTQPRYFCKGCRRYWTEGGSLRNVPVGGGSRKNKRSSSSTYKLPDLNPSHHDHQNPNNNKAQAGQDLNLSFQGSFMQLPKMENPCSNNSSSSSSALDLLRSTGIGTNSFMDSNSTSTLYSSSSAPAGGFSLQSSTHHHHQLMSFPVMDAHANNSNNTGRLFFPFGDFNKQVTAAAGADQDHKGNANRYWNGMLQGRGGGGSSW